MGRLSLRRFQAPLLEPFDLELADGECITLTGPSGSGKSRLLRSIADLDPNEGFASVNDQPRAEMSGPQWRRQVGLLPAESHWWGERVEEHFQGMEEEIIELLGFPTACADWSVSRLSSGEKQRLSLARLLQNRPQVLLLDEPTANLDRQSGERVERLIQQWRSRHGCSVIWVTHDREQQARIAGRHFLIHGGRLEESSWS